MNKKLELEELYKYIYNSELLVIDDLGTETTNAFVCSKLFEVINQRDLPENRRSSRPIFP